MLRNSFQHIPGIGEKAEKQLWNSGIIDWTCFSKTPGIKLSPSKIKTMTDHINDIKNYNVIVSYNGKTFDVPFIEHYFNTRLNHAHIDLRYVLKSLGYSGGLKKSEKALGVGRGDLDGVDGYFAILLWLDFQQNQNKKALETLLAYNIEDVVNLETLIVKSYNMKIKDTPFSQTHLLPIPKAPKISLTPDPETIDRIKREMVSLT